MEIRLLNTVFHLRRSVIPSSSILSSSLCTIWKIIFLILENDLLPSNLVKKCKLSSNDWWVHQIIYSNCYFPITSSTTPFNFWFLKSKPWLIVFSKRFLSQLWLLNVYFSCGHYHIIPKKIPGFSLGIFLNLVL